MCRDWQQRGLGNLFFFSPFFFFCPFVHDLGARPSPPAGSPLVPVVSGQTSAGGTGCGRCGFCRCPRGGEDRPWEGRAARRSASLCRPPPPQSPPVATRAQWGGCRHLPPPAPPAYHCRVPSGWQRSVERGVRHGGWPVAYTGAPGSEQRPPPLSFLVTSAGTCLASPDVTSSLPPPPRVSSPAMCLVSARGGGMEMGGRYTPASRGRPWPSASPLVPSRQTLSPSPLGALSPDPLGRYAAAGAGLASHSLPAWKCWGGGGARPCGSRGGSRAVPRRGCPSSSSRTARRGGEQV